IFQIANSVLPAPAVASEHAAYSNNIYGDTRSMERIRSRFAGRRPTKRPPLFLHAIGAPAARQLVRANGTARPGRALVIVGAVLLGGVPLAGYAQDAGSRLRDLERQQNLQRLERAPEPTEPEARPPRELAPERGETFVV